MKLGYTAAMHEGPRSSDVSNRPGPNHLNPKVQYFQVREKGGSFSGMCPTFAFINDSTMATLSFGRANTTLLLLHIGDSISVLDQLPVPGRGSTALELAGKKGRSKIFSNTAGGAYSYISNQNRIYIPGANNNILRVSLNGRKFNYQVESINLKAQIEAGNLVDPDLSDKDKLNQLTALMPDAQGNIWFTSRQGVIGLIHREDKTESGCPKVYSTFVGYYGLEPKIRKYVPQPEEKIKALAPYLERKIIDQDIRKKIREVLEIQKGVQEEIQNSFSVGKDGVYIVSNFALYKFRFNEDLKRIELDPEWAHSFQEQNALVYDNDLEAKPGHLNAGSGTTPTLLDDRYVAICDNAQGQINLVIYKQKDGSLVSKLPLFDKKGSAVENSAVAYDNTYIVANTYGYADPFKVNPTPGGIMRFDLNPKTEKFEKMKGWPESGNYDCKTATPKLSTASGMLYVYNRADQPVNGHRDWQITTIDYHTGLRVLASKLYFEKGEFQDNINLFMKAGSLGSKNYDRKVFNNIWGTFTFGPNQSFYLGTYRGFIRVSSEPF